MLAEYPAELVMIALALTASLVVGLPVRIVGWRATLAGFGLVRRGLRAHRWKILLVLVIGSLAGLWRFDSVRDLAFSLF
ncbi:hypothetical protein F1654_09525 [Alkalicaulis satelles]|uniref:Uncharacterized protein n=1 Tax=Alkalicaulis satelles TaxID=2609175 RepID=A0A5M6ZGW7_9PROT|nr:hypothetical protein [Alkalicaulis satelles]KAA5804013.1 hypothetical protein F1654_09525 [Alkalicaulis satelles]